MNSSGILAGGSAIRIEHIDCGGFSVCVARQPVRAILLLVLVLLMLVVAIAPTCGVVALGINFPRDHTAPAVIAIGLFSAMALLAWWGTFVVTLMWLRVCFDRVLEFDAGRRELRLRNVPLFSRAFPLHRVSAVVICSGTLQWGMPAVWLCLAIEGKRRKLLIESAVPTTPEEKKLAKGITSAGQAISKLLGVPLHKQPGVGLLEISFI
jgi:hypothetical protein